MHLCTNPNSDGGKSPYIILPHNNMKCFICEKYMCNNCRVVINDHKLLCCLCFENVGILDSNDFIIKITI